LKKCDTSGCWTLGSLVCRNPRESKAPPLSLSATACAAAGTSSPAPSLPADGFKIEDPNPQHYKEFNASTELAQLTCRQALSGFLGILRWLPTALGRAKAVVGPLQQQIVPVLALCLHPDYRAGCLVLKGCSRRSSCSSERSKSLAFLWRASFSYCSASAFCSSRFTFSLFSRPYTAAQRLALVCSKYSCSQQRLAEVICKAKLREVEGRKAVGEWPSLTIPSLHKNEGSATVPVCGNNR